MMVSYVSDAALLTKTFAEHQVKPLAFIGTSGGFADPPIMTWPEMPARIISIFPPGNRMSTVRPLRKLIRSLKKNTAMP